MRTWTFTTMINIRRYNSLKHNKIPSSLLSARSSKSRWSSPMIHILLAAVFNHIFVHLQALLREKYSDMRILLTTHPNEIVYSALNNFAHPFRQHRFYVIHRAPLICWCVLYVVKIVYFLFNKNSLFLMHWMLTVTN